MVGVDFDRQPWVFARPAGSELASATILSATRGVCFEAQQPRHLPTVCGKPLDRLADVFERGSDPGEESGAGLSVRDTLRVVRAKSGSPRRSSTVRTAWLTADALMPSPAAAGAKPRFRATLTATADVRSLSIYAQYRIIHAI
jgi:hypothetical protein